VGVEAREDRMASCSGPCVERPGDCSFWSQEKNVMITIREDYDFDGSNLVNDFLSVFVSSPTVEFNGTSGDATYHWTFDGDTDAWNRVEFQGTNLNTPSGVITRMNFVWTIAGDSPFSEIIADGFHMSSAGLMEAINAASGGDRSELKAIFKGLDWAVDLAFRSRLVFGGTGGNDTITFGDANDLLQLDGGNDKVKLGAGDDTINLDNFLGYAAPGLSQIDGEGGHDHLDLSTQGADRLITHGLIINLNKKIGLGDFGIHLKSVEVVTGTKFADNIIGTSGNDWLYGGGGGDKLTGGRGRDELTGSEGAGDTFIYHKANNSRVGEEHDAIYGFEHDIDVIDLSLIDSGTKNHKFHFVGNQLLGDAGDLHLVVHDELGIENDYTLVQASLDKDHSPEFEIKFMGDVELSKADFLL
jgi:Ca2+-binding RTX toxin-like protein